jgi:hypothetical protein
VSKEVIAVRTGFLVMVFLITALTTNALAQEETAWKKVGDSDGIMAYMRLKEGSSIYHCKATGMVNASMASIEAVLRDVPAMKEYAFNCSEACLVDLPGMEKSKDILYAYVKMNMPWPVQDRDSVAQIKFTVDPQTGTLYARGEGFKTDYRLSQDVIRTPINILKYTVVPKGTDKSEMTVEMFVDPGGSLPVSVINLFARFGPIMSFKSIRKTATSEKYRNTPSVITTTVASR